MIRYNRLQLRPGESQVLLILGRCNGWHLILPDRTTDHPADQTKDDIRDLEFTTLMRMLADAILNLEKPLPAKPEAMAKLNTQIEEPKYLGMAGKILSVFKSNVGTGGNRLKIHGG